MRRAALALLLLGACSAEPADRSDGDRAGPALEKAALARGLVPDPDGAPLTGLFAREMDRLCLLGEGDTARAGISIDYDAGNGCSATGSAERRSGGLSFELGEGCRIEALYDGGAIRFPGAVPDECAALCRGNASLAGLAVERLSDSRGEVGAFRDRSGHFPCGSGM